MTTCVWGDGALFAEEMAECDQIAKHRADHGRPCQAGQLKAQDRNQQKIKRDIGDICYNAAQGKQLCSPIEAERSFRAQKHLKKGAVTNKGRV